MQKFKDELLEALSFAGIPMDKIQISHAPCKANGSAGLRDELMKLQRTM